MSARRGRRAPRFAVLPGRPALAALSLGLIALTGAGCDDNAFCFSDCDGAQAAGGARGTGGAGGDEPGLGGFGHAAGGAPPCTADTQNDVENCGECGRVCLLPGAIPRCQAGQCAIDACIDGAYDIDRDDATGCEYTCPVPVLGPELCNGIDDDCDSLVDSDDPDLRPPPGLCNTTPGTPCEQTVIRCDGAAGWSCLYPPDVEVVSGFVRQNETRCDGLDGNCDGEVDEWFVDLGAPCTDGNLGRCTDGGIIVCDPADPARTACDLSAPPDPLPRIEELCNGVDDDCDGVPDDDLAPSAFSMQLIAGTSPPVFVDSYEAARPDATRATPGILETVACSNADALPWTGGSYGEAEAACAARGPGFRLCTAAELERACRGAAGTLYPYGATYSESACNGIDNALAASGAAPTGSLATCSAGGAGVFDLSGNVTEWTRTQANTAAAPDRIFLLHGGSYLSPRLGLACTMELPARAAESTLLPNIGFRCCRQ